MTDPIDREALQSARETFTALAKEAPALGDIHCLIMGGDELGDLDCKDLHAAAAGLNELGRARARIKTLELTIRGLICGLPDLLERHAMTDEERLIEKALAVVDASETITIDGREYRRFVCHPDTVADGTVRCFCCGQIDEPAFHIDELCAGTGGPHHD